LNRFYISRAAADYSRIAVPTKETPMPFRLIKETNGQLETVEPGEALGFLEMLNRNCALEKYSKKRA
jgi:hypothetical protein